MLYYLCSDENFQWPEIDFNIQGHGVFFLDLIPAHSCELAL